MPLLVQGLDSLESWCKDTIFALTVIKEAFHLGYILQDVNSTSEILVCNGHASFAFSRPKSLCQTISQVFMNLGNQ